MRGAPEVVAVGSALPDEQYRVSNLPEPDGGAFVHEKSVAFGGVAANVAVALSRLGRSTGIVVRLGNDDVAGDVLANLLEEGVATDRVRRCDDETSTYCMVFCDPAGERTTVTVGGAARDLRLTETDEDYLGSTDLVFANGFCPDRVTDRLGTLAANGEIRLAFDLASPVDGLLGRGTEPETVDELLSHLALFVANEASVRSYLDAVGVEAVNRLRDRGARRGALTRGEDGAILWDGDSIVDVPAIDVEVVDTTGAGDAFVSGLLHRWLLGEESPEDAARFATAAAGYNCTEPGARGGMVDDDRIATILRDHPAV